MSVLGTRYEALRLRRRLEALLGTSDIVELDFAGVLVTQSFADELLGPLALRIGPALLEKVCFAGCIEDTKDILRLVLSGRMRDHTIAAGRTRV